MKRQAPRAARPVTIGRDRFRKISAVEGLSLTYSAREEFDLDEDSGLTPEERRRRIINKYVGG